MALTVDDGSPWARFTMPSNLLSFRQPRQKRVLTDEQRESLRVRLSAARSR